MLRVFYRKLELICTAERHQRFSFPLSSAAIAHSLAGHPYSASIIRHLTKINSSRYFAFRVPPAMNTFGAFDVNEKDRSLTRAVPSIKFDRVPGTAFSVSHRVRNGRPRKMISTRISRAGIIGIYRALYRRIIKLSHLFETHVRS